MPLTELQIDYLRRPLNTQRVARRTDGGKNLSYLEAWDVKAHLTRIFGFCNWDAELLDYRPLFEREYTVKRPARGERAAYDEQMIEVAYSARVQLVVRDKDGETLCRHSEAAVGQANVKAESGSRGDAHDNAIKQAESDALKRCAINLGTQFGLSLYDNGATNDVIRWTLIPDRSETMPANEDVPAVTSPQDAEQRVAATLGATKVES